MMDQRDSVLSIQSKNLDTRSTRTVVYLLAVWLSANFLLPGLISLLAGKWYLGWESQTLSLLAELGSIQLPNLLLPIFLLYLTRPQTEKLKEILGWQWTGWRAIGFGSAAFLLILLLSTVVNRLSGMPIPYNLPGRSPISAHSLSGIPGVLTLLLIYVGLTSVGEETMFRGLLQGQLSRRFGAVPGILGAALLFGLRHLPADIFYGHAWNATPGMWVSRELQLYGTGLLLGLACYFGRSTYASWIAHLLLLGATLFIGG
jgi:membrane protease YdiL (CAAX protease family)